jgi:hypothetical protein
MISENSNKRNEGQQKEGTIHCGCFLQPTLGQTKGRHLRCFRAIVLVTGNARHPTLETTPRLTTAESTSKSKQGT